MGFEEMELWYIAYASLFLVSEEVKYITGQVIALDGGLMALGQCDRRAFAYLAAEALLGALMSDL
jgi:hypothetical protein